MNLGMSAFQKCMVEILPRIVPVNPSGSWTITLLAECQGLAAMHY